MDKGDPLFREAALSAYRNAVALHGSATATAAVGNYGHASALCVLSIEELGKSIAFRLCFERHAHLEGRGKGTELVLTLPLLPERRYFLFKHEPKRDLVTGLLLAYLIPAIGGILIAVASAPKGKEQLAKLAETESTSREPIQIRLEDLDKLREAGLYVELNGDKLTAPQDFSESSFQELSKATRAFLDATKDSHEHGITEQFFGLVEFAFERLVELSEKWRNQTRV